MPWDPAQYERFKRERELPFVDTLALIGPLEEGSAIDLGCGTGALTAKLADALPGMQVLGIDTSTEMLAEAKKRERPGLRFVKAAIEAVDQIGPAALGQPGPSAPGQGGFQVDLGAVPDAAPQWQLVFSHAALQWVGDHHRLVPRLFACVAPGGRLVTQLPSNHDSVAHRTLFAIADESPFRESFAAPVAERPVLSAAAYAELLWRAGGRDIVAFEKVYPHEMPDTDAIVEWMKGTALVPYLGRLPPPLRPRFVARFAEVLRDAMPLSHIEGREQPALLFAFKRTLFAATR